VYHLYLYWLLLLLLLHQRGRQSQGRMRLRAAGDRLQKTPFALNKVMCVSRACLVKLIV